MKGKWRQIDDSKIAANKFIVQLVGVCAVTKYQQVVS